MGKSCALLEIGCEDVIALVLVNNAEKAGGGAGLTVDVIAQSRDFSSASLHSFVHCMPERFCVAEGDLAKDVRAREAVDTAADVALERDGISVAAEPEADDGALGDVGDNGLDGWN